MLYIKEFDKKRLVLSDGEKDYVLTCKNEDEEFDINVIEDIINYKGVEDKKEWES